MTSDSVEEEEKKGRKGRKKTHSQVLNSVKVAGTEWLTHLPLTHDFTALDWIVTQGLMGRLLLLLTCQRRLPLCRATLLRWAYVYHGTGSTLTPKASL